MKINRKKWRLIKATAVECSTSLGTCDCLCPSCAKKYEEEHITLIKRGHLVSADCSLRKENVPGIKELCNNDLNPKCVRCDDKVKKWLTENELKEIVKKVRNETSKL